jgi:hypothetical protein
MVDHLGAGAGASELELELELELEVKLSILGCFCNWNLIAGVGRLGA